MHWDVVQQYHNEYEPLRFCDQHENRRSNDEQTTGTTYKQTLIGQSSLSYVICMNPSRTRWNFRTSRMFATDNRYYLYEKRALRYRCEDKIVKYTRKFAGEMWTIWQFTIIKIKITHSITQKQIRNIFMKTCIIYFLSATCLRTDAKIETNRCRAKRSPHALIE